MIHDNDAGWLDRQMLRSAEHLLALDPLLLGPVARELLPFAEDVVARDRRSKIYVIPPEVGAS
jgi:hypothetical protein